MPTDIGELLLENLFVVFAAMIPLLLEAILWDKTLDFYCWRDFSGNLIVTSSEIIAH